MASPTVKDVHIDGVLTKISVGYSNGQYIGRILCPACPVDKRSDNYYVFGKENFNREASTLRTSGKPAQEVDYSLSSDSYSCKNHALKEYVPKDVEDAADTPLKPRNRATKNVTDRLLLDEEYEVAASLFSATVITNNVTLDGTDQWDDFANSNPISDIETGKQSVFDLIGKEANLIAMGKQVWDEVKNHPDLLDRIKYSMKGIITEQLVAEVFGVQNLVVGKVLYNTAKEGQTFSPAHVWGKKVLVAYVEPKPALESPTLCYNFMFQDFQTRTWFDEDRKSTAVEVENIRDIEIVDVNAGYLIVDAVS